MIQAVDGATATAATRTAPPRIVVPLDGSPRAERVLPHVEEMAARTGAKVTLVRAWSRRSDADAPAGVRAFLAEALPRPADRAGRNPRHEAESYLEGVVDRLREHGLAADYEAVEGPPGEMIVDEAEGLGADMVAMATHGRSRFGRLVLGSVADYVLRHGAVPVLLVRVA